MPINQLNNGDSGLTARTIINELVDFANSGSVDTGSFATTGSNVFVGNQTISGSIDFGDGSQIQSISASSGDGYGYTTLEIKPDATLNTDQYIVLDPTTPNHIHIRAGGTIDSSSAYLYLGGEYNNVLIDDPAQKVYITSVNATNIISSLEQGSNVLASGSYSHAEGEGSQAIGNYSHAEGEYSQTIGIYSHAEGTNAQAIGYYSHAEGENTQAIGPSSHAEGSNTQAIGGTSHAEGDSTISGWKGFTPSISLGTASIQQTGDFTNIFIAPGTAITDVGLFTYNSSSFDGTNTIIYLDDVNNAGGIKRIADINDLNNPSAPNFLGTYSHAEGVTTKALSEASHAEGSNTQAIGVASHAEGSGTQAIGDWSHTEGVGTEAIGDYSHAEGENTQAIGAHSHAEGYLTIASGSYSHAEGNGTQAIGNNSHAEGRSTQAIGDSSHAEGDGTLSIGNQSHTEGANTQATGDYSHAEGASTVTYGYYSHAEGDTTKTGWRGFVCGGVNSGTASISDIGDFTNVFPAPSTIITNAGLYTYNSSSFDGTNTIVYLDDTGASFFFLADLDYLYEPSASYLAGPYSHAEGANTQATGDYSHAEGDNARAIGLYSHAEGYLTQTIGNLSHAEGSETQAIGVISHAEGRNTQAIGFASHAEGNATQAIGLYSHAEGNATQAIGNASHAEGNATIASGSYQHVSGKYNTHGDDTSLFIIGNGIDNNNRSDAFKVRQSGSIILPVTSSNTPAWTGVDGEMMFGDDGSGNYVIWAYLGGQWRSGSLN